MWQTAMRGYGADWTLTQYFVWYYLEHGKKFRPQDIAAGNRLAAIESLDAGVTTTVDWSHNLHTVDHGEAALEALRSVPGRFVLAYGNIQAGPWEWTADPAVRCWSGCATPPTTGWACRSPSTSPGTRASRRRPRSRWPASSASR
jgi:cytosine/adenosine deaminase-related metal-dependent hydrolase